MATLALSLAGQAVGGLIGGPIGATIGRALGALAGSSIDQALFGDSSASTTGADIRLQYSQQGTAIPRAYGWNRLAGNIIWATELERSEASSSGNKALSASSDEEVILANFAVAFCQGEVAHVGRIWADGDALDTDGLTIRFYAGSETQQPDSLILAKQGAGRAPAYRGICYMVFEALPLTEFGNRIPNISVELCRPIGDLEPAIRAVTIIPAATEFGYDPTPRVRIVSRGETASENAHVAASVSDWTLSLDELQALCPNLERVALVIAWFGTDLRCAECQLEPRVESNSREIRNADWQVSGLSRETANPVSEVEDGPAYGGTPSDSAVIAAIADLKARGLDVTLYPIVLMDIAADNTLTDPYTGTTGQPAYPWRGRITCHPAPGVTGTVDLTSAAATQIEDFIGAASPGDFTASGQAVSFAGGSDWGYRRMILHYAKLATLAGGVDGFLIGSELRGLTTVRSDSASFPFVDALAALVADVRSVVGTATRLTYAADWSEYAGLQPADAPGDKLFHLDPLWAHADIDAVGIDNYMALADWRDGTDHLDAGWGDIYALDYLRANIAGGEGHEWYYASEADRHAQTRTAIADGAYGEPFVWRVKDLVNWWSQSHYNRIDGVRAATPTDWLPQSKPLWFTELGCGAVDKGANTPSAFTDPKSAEDTRPHFSNGAPDALMQRQFLRAHLGYWSPEGEAFTDAANPVSSVYGNRMVDPSHIYLWTWDARPYPAFPSLTDVWSDGPNHMTGHWLTGRLGGMAVDELLAALAGEFGTQFNAVAAAGVLLNGLTVSGVVTLRDVAEPLWRGCGLVLRATPDGLQALRPAAAALTTFEEGDLVGEQTPLLKQTWPVDADLPDQFGLSFTERLRDYQTASVTAIAGQGAVGMSESLPLTLGQGAARRFAENRLNAARQSAAALEFALPPSLAGLEPGDRVMLDGLPGPAWVVSELRDDTFRRITAVPELPRSAKAMLVDGRETTVSAAGVLAVPEIVLAHLPPDPATGGATRMLAGAYAKPWPGTITLTDTVTGAGLGALNSAATLGELAEDLPAGTGLVWDRAAPLELTLFGGHLASDGETAVLSGTNRLLMQSDTGSWELIGFAEAELVDTARYRLTGLLRGLQGTAIGAASAGAMVMAVTGAVLTSTVDDQRLGGTLSATAYAGSKDTTGTAISADLDIALAQPLAPVHLQAERDADTGDVTLSWIRRTRLGGDSWGLAEVPLDATPESYRITIFDGTTAVRTLTAAEASLTYSAADQIADFGALPAEFTFTAAQVSASFGAGAVATGAFHV